MKKIVTTYTVTMEDYTAAGDALAIAGLRHAAADAYAIAARLAKQLHSG